MRASVLAGCLIVCALAGGFCLTAETRSVGANDYLDDGLAAQLVGLFRHSRVLDLGCGLGHYGHFLQARVRRLARVCQAGMESKEGFSMVWQLSLPCHAVRTAAMQAVVQGSWAIGGATECVMGALHAWRQGIEWTGYDGAENIELATDDVHFADLTVPQWFGHKFDWVLSLEARGPATEHTASISLNA